MLSPQNVHTAAVTKGLEPGAEVVVTAGRYTGRYGTVRTTSTPWALSDDVEVLVVIDSREVWHRLAEIEPAGKVTS